MDRCAVNFNIYTNQFPEIGSPLFPRTAREAKIPKKDKDDYNAYYSSASMSGSLVAKDIGDANLGFAFPDNISIELTLDRDVSKTYKFLGMDIDENFDAVIKIGSGHIVVAHMFDKSYLEDAIDKVSGGSYTYLVSGVTEEVVRKLVTSLKTGAGYSIDRALKDNGSVDKSFFAGIADIIGKALDDSSSSETAVFKSIMLNLIHSKKSEQSATRGSVVSDDVARYFVHYIFDYWSSVVLQYNACYSFLASMDLWSDMNRRLLGDSEFNQRLRSCMYLFDSTTKEFVNGVLSFSGVAKNGGIYDDNVIRSSASQSLKCMGNAIIGKTSGSDTFFGSYGAGDLQDFLVGLIDTDGIDDVYGMSSEELQAFSVLDSLVYIDDDAKLCKESYDMDDPDQRGLFVKSAIRSYERNFREFKPARNYDVTDALAEMVERGDIVSTPNIISRNVATDDTAKVVVTSTVEDISALVNKNQILKVLKLVDKSVERVLKGF